MGFARLRALTRVKRTTMSNIICLVEMGFARLRALTHTLDKIDISAICAGRNEYRPIEGIDT